jgi:hypothetical protein
MDAWMRTSTNQRVAQCLVAAVLLAAMVCLASASFAAPRPSLRGRLTPCGRHLCQADGKPFRWRGVTAFALLAHVAQKKEHEAGAFLDWARDRGFTVVRVLTMLPEGGWMTLAVEDGRRALPRLFQLAGERGLYVEAVALANTQKAPHNTRRFFEEQVRAVGEACAAVENCLLEIANEPYHGTQANLEDAALMRTLQDAVPKEVPVAWGAARDYKSDVMAGGSFVTSHTARSGDRWARAARARDLEQLSKTTGKFVVDDEPIGAAEKDVRNRRDANPAVFFAQGILSRIFELGSTFHCEDCLHARVPGPNQQRSAEAFIEGATLVPDEVVLEHVEAGAKGAPIGRRGLEGDRAYAFAGVSGDRGWLVLIGIPDAKALEWTNGWRAGSHVAFRPGIEVWTIARDPSRPR